MWVIYVEEAIEQRKNKNKNRHTYIDSPFREGIN